MKYNIKEIREQFKDLFENSLDLIWVNDLKGNFLDANDIALKTLGYERDQISQISFINLLNKENLIKAINITREIVERGKQTERSDYKLKSKDGKEIYIETYAIPLKREGKVYAILGIGNDITERKIAALKLKESEAKYRHLFENSPYFVGLVNLNGNLIDCNDRIENFITVHKKNDLIGRNFREIFSLNERNKFNIPIFEEKFENILKGENQEPTIFKLYRTKGEPLWLSLRGSLINLEGSKLIQFIIQDITDHKNAEEKLLESEIHFRSIVENSHAGILIVNDKYKFTYVNNELCNMLGYSYDEIIGQDFRDFLDEKSKILVADRYVRRQKGENVPHRYEFNIIRKNGEKRHVEIISTVSTELKGGIQTIAQILDMTEGKIIKKQLADSEKKYRRIFEDSPFSIVLINSNSEIIDCNPAMENLCGYKKEELIGNNYGKLDIIHPDFLPNLKNFFVRFLQGEELHRMDIKLIRKDTKVIWTNLQASLIKLRGNTYVQVILIDITRKKEADLLIQEEVQKLKELDKIRKDLISRVSHELKTPLVSVCGGTELLLKQFRKNFDKEEIELLELIQKGGKRLKHLVDNLLDITRIEYQKFKLEKKRENLGELIRELSKEMMYLIKERNLILNLEIPDDLYINVDKIRIEQVITNLILNAVKNTAPQGYITVKLREQDNWAEISVLDTGVGLTDDEMNIIFTRFGKIERYGQGLEYIDIQGSGLGLYISKEIIDLHGGQIRAESEGRNKGSTFIVKLPR